MDPRCAVTNYITSEWSALINIRVHFHRRETLHHEPDPSAHHAAKQAGRQIELRFIHLLHGLVCMFDACKKGGMAQHSSPLAHLPRCT